MTALAVVVTAHWRARVRERMGREVAAAALAKTIAAAIHTSGPGVQYLGRVSRSGKRIYRFAFPGGLNGTAMVVMDERHIRFITVFDSGWRIPRQGKRSVRT